MSKFRPSQKGTTMMSKFRRKSSEETTEPKKTTDSSWNTDTARNVDDPDDGRFIQIPRIDVYRPVPYTRPDSGEMREAVRQRIGALAQQGALDEGSGGVADLWIDSKTKKQIAVAQGEEPDHKHAIAVHVGRAKEYKAEVEVALDHAEQELEKAEAEAERARTVLAGEDKRDAANAAETGSKRSHRRANRSWEDPSLLAGRSTLKSVAMFVCIILGLGADLYAFKTCIDIVVQSSELASWVIAVGLTSGSLVAAWSLGTLYARFKHEPKAGIGAMPPLALVWVGLGVAAAGIRIYGTANTTATGGGFGQTQDPHVHTWMALLFFMLYLLSGLVTFVEATHLANPEYRSYRQANKEAVKARKQVQHLTGEKERASHVVDLQQEQYDRDKELLASTIDYCKALGAECKNLARMLIAESLGDPSKTDLASYGPMALDDPFPYSDGSHLLPTSKVANNDPNKGGSEGGGRTAAEDAPSTEDSVEAIGPRLLGEDAPDEEQGAA